MKDFFTLADLIYYQANKFNNPTSLNFKHKKISNRDFFNQAFYFACALKEIGLQKNQTFAIVCQPSPTWLIVDFGAILAGAITVPIFHNISDENLLFEISDAKINYLFCDNSDIEKKSLGLKKIINTKELEDMILLGKQLSAKYEITEFLNEIKPQDLATIIYTSGSTGQPKGVELTHENLVSQIKGTAQVFELNQSDVALSFLPLAHIFERMVMMFYLSQGISIHFCDDVKNLGKLIKEVRPNLMTSVPRMLEKVFSKIKEGANSKAGIAKILATTAIKRALNKDCCKNKDLIDFVFDHLVYKKFRLALGGNMRMIICGGAALSLDMERFYRNIGINIFCGYGLTETSPVLAVNHAKAHKFSTVGQAFPGVELKIAQDGELLARGKNLMQGYHNQTQKTAEVIVDGWFKTGDLGFIDEEGFLKIIGRKKELFKTANGKYVAPVPIEQKLVQELGFTIGAIVIAEGKKFTSCIIFPDFDLLSNFKKKMSAEKKSDEEFLTSKDLENFVFNKINIINQNLDHWQKLQKFHIATTPISIESGEITPSMKLKRNVLEEKYKKVIDSFYEER